MAEILSSNEIKKLKKGDTIDGVVLIQKTEVALTKQGNEYITGSCLCGDIIPFKAWNSSTAFEEFKKIDYMNIPARVIGTFDDFGGNASIVVKQVFAVEGFTPEQFMASKYNTEAYWEALKQQINAVIKNEDVKKLLDKILFENEEVSSRFKVEFAAKSHHDNCKSGLLVHTYKVVNLTAFLLRAYPNLKVNSDLVIMGALLHDIGKIEEMNFGVYQPNSFVSHRYFGVEILSPYKDDVIAIFGESGWYELMSIILQHHGDYEENCKTVSSFIVHKADALDAEVTLLADAMQADVESVKINDKYLRIVQC